MNLEKLKDSARKFEQKEEWRKAIDVYLKAIQQIESGAESSPDLSLYNRVGDLYLKINDTPAAVRSYERAVDLYADQGFFNNAIALCGKILRVNPGRTQTYLKLAQLHARKNVVIEAKRNLIEFLERMNALGQLDPAFQSVKEFADQFSGSQEIRLMLVELLRASSREEEAQEQLRKLAGDIEARGGAPSAPVPDRPSDSEAQEHRRIRAAADRPGGAICLPRHRRGYGGQPRTGSATSRFPRTPTCAAAGGATRTRWSRCSWTASNRPTKWTSPCPPTTRSPGSTSSGYRARSCGIRAQVPIEDLSVEEISVEEMDDLDASLPSWTAESRRATEGLPLIEVDASADLAELENRVATIRRTPTCTAGWPSISSARTTRCAGSRSSIWH